MSTAGFLLFFFSGVLALTGAVATVIAKRPLRAAMGLLLHVVALSALYLTLNSHLLAVLQLLIYAGAVVVLFVFVILLLGPAGEFAGGHNGLIGRVMAGCSAGAVLLLTAFSLSRHDAPFGSVGADYGTVEGLGEALYLGAMAPFEMVSITLLVAVVGAVAISRVRTAREKASDAADAEARKLANAGGSN
jgi:NADH-quinone oxidoreductase subunit J